MATNVKMKSKTVFVPPGRMRARPRISIMVHAVQYAAVVVCITSIVRVRSRRLKRSIACVRTKMQTRMFRTISTMSELLGVRVEMVRRKLGGLCLHEAKGE